MSKTQLKRVKIYGHLYHLVTGRVTSATKDRRWREEVSSSSSFFPGEFRYDYHHIGGRSGCLRWMVENGVMIPRALHGKEKSTDPKDRIKFHHDIQKLVGKKKFGRILRIKNWYRYVGNGYKFPPEVE